MGNELADTIGGLLNEQESMKTDYIETAVDISTQFLINTYSLKIQKKSFKLEGKAIGSGLILGHPTFGKIGSVDNNPLGSGGFGEAETIYDLTAPANITDWSKNEIAKLVGSEIINDLGWFSYGNSVIAYNESQTTLGSELDDNRIGHKVITGSAGIVTFTFDFTNRTQAEVNEFGIFTGSDKITDSGSIYHRQVLPTSEATIGGGFDTPPWPIAFAYDTDFKLNSGSYYTATYQFQIFDNTGAFGLIPDIGISKFTNWFSGSTFLAPNTVEWTNSSILPTGSDISLGSEEAGLGSLSGSIILREIIGNKIKFTSYIEGDELVGSTIRKTGIFDAAPEVGSLLAVTSLSPIEKSKFLDIQQIDIINVD